jgi:3'-phosphoadenosine 5'-phosphosulfate sulfotransferase (PAPS reductase)/FAD synthetase
MKDNSADKLFIAQSVIDSAYRSHKHKRVAVLWSGGKDSTALLHMIRRQYGKIPFRVVYGDLNFKNRELSEFITDMSGQWSFPVIREEILTKEDVSNLRCCQNDSLLSAIVDTKYLRSIKRLIKEKHIEAFIFGNRWSESKKNAAFVKKAKGITYYYPFVQLSDLEMWEYIYTRGIPFLSAYRKGIRRTSPIMFLNKPSVINRAASLAMHTWFRIRFQFLKQT